MAGGDPEQTEEDVPVPLPTESTSTLTRAGSLTPQWMQAKTGRGLTHPTRGRLGSDLERQPDSARRGRTDSIGGQDPLVGSKAKDNDRGQSRAAKRTPEERESWKSKERWATGPDSARKWTGVQVSGREREGWTSGDSLSRSVSDRWNTEGGRWTDERPPVEEKEYVPKNSRWNDEERGDRWRSSLSARGENPRSRTSPGPKATLTRRTPSEVPTTGSDLLNGGLHSFSKSQSKCRFSQDQLLKIYRRLLEKTGSILPLPEGVDVSYPGFLKTDRESILDSESKPGDKSEPQMEDNIEGVSSMELEADSWVYKDPSGMVRGPYTKEEVLDWWQEGYFPVDLQIQSQLSSTENWMPLSKLLTIWKVSLDRVDPAPPMQVPSSLEAEKIDKNLEHTSSLPTVGSHIPVSALMEAAALERTPEDDTLKAPHVMLQTSPVATMPPQSNQKLQFQNTVPDLQQTMQNLMLQQQKQNQAAAAAAAMSGLNFGNNPLAPGANPAAGLRPGFPPAQLQQNNPLLGGGGFGLQQQQHPGALQDNSLLSPAVIEALQRRVQAQQQQQELNRSQMQGAGFNFNLNPAAMNRNQMTGNANLAALFQRSNAALNQQPSAQQILQELQQRNLMNYDSQRLMEARNLNPQANQNPLLGAPGANSINPAMFGAVNRGGAGLFPGLQGQGNWNPATGQGSNPGGGYPALNSLLQRPQSIQAQAQLLGNLQGMRFPDQMGQLARQSSASMTPRDNLLSLSGLQSSGSIPDAILQQRQRSNMSPTSGKYQFQPDPNFALMGQTSTANPALGNFNFAGNQQTPPFPQHILQHLSSARGAETATSSAVNPLQTSSVSSPVPVMDPAKNPVLPEALGQKPGTLGNAWGVSPASSHPASLLEIQEEESKGSSSMMSGSQQQQLSLMKERQVQAPTAGLSLGSSWNAPRVKPTSFMDIMQEDEASKKQAQTQVPAQQPSPGPKKGPVWAKIATTVPMATGGAPRKTNQAPPHGINSINSNVTSTEETKKEAENEGFLDLDGARSSSVFDASQLGNGGSLFPGQISISVEFREWCRESMVQLGGSGDFALIEFLMSLKSRSEIAEYIQEYFTDAPSDKLSSFITEFMKRKEANDNQMKKEKPKKTKVKSNSGESSMKRNSVDVESTNISTSPDGGGSDAGLASETSLTKTGSLNKATTRARDVKPKAKKTVKGQHVPPDMLGFISNVNADARYRSGSTG